jgi:hypothetical protein
MKLLVGTSQQRKLWPTAKQRQKPTLGPLSWGSFLSFPWVSVAVSVNATDYISVMAIAGNRKSRGMIVLLCGISIAPLSVSLKIMASAVLFERHPLERRYGGGWIWLRIASYITVNFAGNHT